MVLWLDAKTHDYVHVDGSGNIYQWDDRSGNGYHATQATTSDRPYYALAGLNGQNVIRFNGLNTYLQFPNIGSYSTLTFFIVFKL